jgi:hypothetical protein
LFGSRPAEAVGISSRVWQRIERSVAVAISAQESHSRCIQARLRLVGPASAMAPAKKRTPAAPGAQVVAALTEGTAPDNAERTLLGQGMPSSSAGGPAILRRVRRPMPKSLGFRLQFGLRIKRRAGAPGYLRTATLLVASGFHLGDSRFG